MQSIYFVVYGKPQGKARPRLTRDGHAYTPKSTRMYETHIRNTFRRETLGAYDLTPAFPAGTPVRLTVRVFHAMPASASRIRKQEMLDGTAPCTRKPDLDNVLKVVADALNGWAYEDDSQLTHIRASRAWSTDARLEVEVADDSR